MTSVLSWIKCRLFTSSSSGDTLMSQVKVELERRNLAEIAEKSYDKNFILAHFEAMESQLFRALGRLDCDEERQNLKQYYIRNTTRMLQEHPNLGSEESKFCGYVVHRIKTVWSPM